MRRIVFAVVAASASLVAACNSAPRNLTDDLEELKRKVEALEKTVAGHDARLKGAKRNPATTTIVLSKSAADKGCDTAKVLDYRVGNQHQRHVRWNIEDECNLIVGSRIELRFTANRKGQYPFPTPNLRSKGLRVVQDKINRDADVDEGVYSYTIYLVPPLGQAVPLLDPELEVEPPPVILTTGTAPPEPAAPPAKKQ